MMDRQVEAENAVGLICNTISSTGEANNTGTCQNEATHHSINLKIRRGCVRTYQLLIMLIHMAVYSLNGALSGFLDASVCCALQHTAPHSLI